MFRYQQSIHRCIALRSGYRLGTYTYFSDRSEFLPPYVYLLQIISLYGKIEPLFIYFSIDGHLDYS